MAEEHDSHYLKSVTSLGDERKVIASEDIYSQSGIKLASRGARIDSSFYDRLVKHKLMSGLDNCMTVDDAVDAAEIASAARQAAETEPDFAKLPELVDMDVMRAAISRIHLNSALAFKMTVARDQRRDIYRHTLRILLLSVYLGIRQKLPGHRLTELATAALFHDLGELHIDPDILGKPAPLTQEERRHIYAHPMTAYVLLKEFPQYHPAISTAVLEHHEYLDGSGYPAGLTSKRISEFGRMLSTAEVAASLLEKSRPEIALKFNKNKHDMNLIGHLSELFRARQIDVHPEQSIPRMNAQLTRLAEAFERWDGLCGDAPVFRLADQRIGEIRQSLYDAGFNPAETGWLTRGIEGNEEAMLDVQALIDETSWQLLSLSREINRLWPGSEGESDAQTINDWIAEYGSPSQT